MIYDNCKACQLDTGYACGAIIFAEVNGEYICKVAAPIFDWMVGMSAKHIGQWLKSKGYKYEWLD